MLKKWECCEIQSLHRRGDSIRRIEEVTHHHRKTIRKILDKGADGGTLKADVLNGKSVRRKQPGREKSLESFKEFLLNEIEKGGSTAKLLMELRGLGFSGSLRSLQRFLRSTSPRATTTNQQDRAWMQLVVQGAKTSSQIKEDIGELLALDEIRKLQEYIRSNPLRDAL